MYSWDCIYYEYGSYTGETYCMINEDDEGCGPACPYYYSKEEYEFDCADRDYELDQDLNSGLF